MKAIIQFELTPPADCTKKQFEEWLRFNLGIVNSMSGKNPLVDKEFELQTRWDNKKPIISILP